MFLTQKIFLIFNFFFSAKLKDVISIEITSSKPLSSINYLLTSRGKLILSARKAIPNKNSFTITFTATFDMVPSAKLVIYYLVSNGDIVSTNIDIPVTGLNNFVSLPNWGLKILVFLFWSFVLRSNCKPLLPKSNLVKRLISLSQPNHHLTFAFSESIRVWCCLSQVRFEKKNQSFCRQIFNG